MRLNNSKQQLAKIISENGGWRDGEFAAQDGDGEVSGYSAKPEWSIAGKYWFKGAVGGWFVNAKVANHHQTILSREEYFHLYPTPDADGWIEWDGEPKSPVENGVLVDVKLKSGAHHEGELLDDASWGSTWGDENITAYRLHKPENNDLTQVDDIDVVESRPTIEQLASDYRNVKGYADRKQQEADAAKVDADAKLKALELACEAIGLLVSPITASHEPEPVITDWRDLRVGDEVECVDYDTEHRFGVVRSIDKRPASQWVEVLHPNMDVSWPSNWCFIRRP